MRPFTRLPLCLALFTFILSGCIQNRCSLPEFEGVCQDKPSDMTMSDQNSSDGCTPSNTNEQTFKFNDITEAHSIHAISMIDGTDKPVIAFNLINEKKKTFYIIAYNKSDPCSSRRRFGQYKIPSQELHTQGISASADGFSFAANFIDNSQHFQYNIGLDLTIANPTSKTNQAWSMNSGSNGTLHVLVESDATGKQLLSASDNRNFSTVNYAPSVPSELADISRIVTGKLTSDQDGMLAWSKNGNYVYFSELSPDSILINASAAYPTIEGCSTLLQQVCPVAMEDITGDHAGELIVATPQSIIIHIRKLSEIKDIKTTQIDTKVQAQAISVSKNFNKKSRKIIWASSKFENNANTVTINTIPVSSIM